MKYFLCLSVFICTTVTLPAQKKAIDSSAITSWPMLTNNAIISNNGKYILYFINNQPASGQTLVVQSTKNSWKKELVNTSSGFMVAEKRQLVFQRNDTLCFFSLKSEKLQPISGVSDYKQPSFGKGTWIAYHLKTPINELVLRNIITGKEQHFTNVTEYSFDENGHVLLLKTINEQEEFLQWIDLETTSTCTIWSATIQSHNTITNSCLDDAGTQLAFMVQKKNTANNAIWYYKKGLNAAVMLAANSSSGITPGFTISNASPYFSLDGQYLFLRLQQPPDTLKPQFGTVMVDVWSYRDSVLQSTQLMAAQNPSVTYAAAINIRNHHITQLEYPDEILLKTPAAQGNFTVVSGGLSITEPWWKTYNQKPYYLVSLKNGSRHQLNLQHSNILFYFSPEGKYLVYYDMKVGAYYSYDLSSGKTINISVSIPTLLGNENDLDGRPNVPLWPVGIAGWLPNDDALLIYDNYDIWKVDPTASMPPVNITNGYGHRSGIKFRIMNEVEPTFFTEPPVFAHHESLLLTAFNAINKHNGFYQKSLNRKGDPKMLSMGPWHVYTTPTQMTPSVNYNPIKAKNKKRWLILRQTANDAPNYFLSKNLKHFTRLTNLQPQQNYNWFSTELITWKQLDGKPAQGILYKPENFDSTKKYPIIFYYYEKLSQQLYQYLQPGFTGGALNIPWFVSHGYLVFTPDIHYTTGQTGESVCNAVVSAAKYFMQMPWVETSHMAITGHSFGGYETNYLVTHTNLFAAAVSAAGVSNLISEYGGLWDKAWGAMSSQGRLETGQYRIGGTLWEKPDLYIKNSPVFNLDKVTTPLLIVHNKADQLVSWSQSIEMFTGLRRLQKKVWMLQYDERGHGVWGKDAVDLTIRITQFFDHYLKGTPPAIWMTEGMPAKFKGIRTGYELDVSGEEP